MYCTDLSFCIGFRLYDERGLRKSTVVVSPTLRRPMQDGCFRIAHISDIHCGGPYFVPSLLERAIDEINDLRPDVVICSGDLTTFGFRPEYQQAREYLDKIECDSLVVIPGNHDSRNVGYVHFDDLFGSRSSVLRKNGVTIVAVDSTEPDLDHGQIGRGRYRWIEEQFSDPADLRVFVLHHHLLPVPGTGRERNIVYDAGDAIECLQRSGVDLVLCGHKHVPYAWKLENLFIVNAGHRLVAAPPRSHAALLQRHRGRAVARRRVAPLPVPRAGEDHPVLDRDPRVPEVHGPHRGRSASALRAIAVIDGEHYAPVVRDALAALPYDFVGALLVGGTEKLRGGEGYGVPLVDSLDELEADVVVDLSDEPVCLAGGALPAREPRARARVDIRRRRLPFRAAAARAVRPSVARR